MCSWVMAYMHMCIFQLAHQVVVISCHFNLDNTLFKPQTIHSLILIVLSTLNSPISPSLYCELCDTSSGTWMFNKSGRPVYDIR